MRTSNIVCRRKSVALFLTCAVLGCNVGCSAEHQAGGSSKGTNEPSEEQISPFSFLDDDLIRPANDYEGPFEGHDDLPEVKTRDIGKHIILPEWSYGPYLDLDKWPLTQVGLQALSQRKDITAVRMPQTTVDDDLKYLAGLTQLKLLGLKNTKVTGSGLKHLSALKDLQVLALGDSPFSDEHAALVRAFPKLEFLFIDRTELSDIGICAMFKDPTQPITHLHVDELDISDQAMSCVGQLSKLTWLGVYETKITNEGLLQLKNCKNLRFVSVGFTQVTDEGIRELEMALPDVYVSTQT